MRLFNWAENFKEQPTCEDIPKKVRNAEIKYWIFLVISIALTIAGINMVIAAPENSIKQHTIGLILTIAGLINIALMKLWAHIILTTYYLIWDSKNRVDAEIRKSQAADL
jgi:uncharacterized Tic20 family protein